MIISNSGSFEYHAQLLFRKLAQYLLFAFAMSDRDGSGSTRHQQQPLEDFGRLLLAFLNNTRSNSSENQYEDIVRRISQHRPAISRSMSDVRSLIPHFMPPSVPSTPTPIKRSEAEGILPSLPVCYRMGNTMLSDNHRGL